MRPLRPCALRSAGDKASIFVHGHKELIDSYCTLFNLSRAAPILFCAGRGTDYSYCALFNLSRAAPVLFCAGPAITTTRAAIVEPTLPRPARARRTTTAATDLTFDGAILGATISDLMRASLCR